MVHDQSAHDRNDVRAVASQPLGDGMGLGRRFGFCLRRAARDEHLGHRVVGRELHTLGPVGKPIGPRIADHGIPDLPAGVGSRPSNWTHIGISRGGSPDGTCDGVHGGGHEGAGRRALRRRRGVGHDSGVRGGSGRHEDLDGRALDALGHPKALGHGSPQHITGGTSPGERGHVGVLGRGHPVTDDEHTATGRRRGRRISPERHRVLVARVHDPAVTHPRQPRRRVLAEVVALGRRLGAALIAIALGPDRATALGAGLGLGSADHHGLGVDRGRDADRAVLVGRGHRDVEGRGRHCATESTTHLGAAVLTEERTDLQGGAAPGARHVRVQLRIALALFTWSIFSSGVAASRASSRKRSSRAFRSDGSSAA